MYIYITLSVSELRETLATKYGRTRSHCVYHHPSVVSRPSARPSTLQANPGSVRGYTATRRAATTHSSMTRVVLSTRQGTTAVFDPMVVAVLQEG